MFILCKDSANECTTCQACLCIFAECSLSYAKIVQTSGKSTENRYICNVIKNSTKMANVIIFDEKAVRDNLLPITYTRPVCEIRVGILTIIDKWRHELPNCSFSYLTEPYLQDKFKVSITDTNLFIAGHVLPDENLVAAISSLAPGEAITADGDTIAFNGSLDDFMSKRYAKATEYTAETTQIRFLYDIFLLNGKALEQDFHKITAHRASQRLSDTNTVIGNPIYPDGTSKIFLEEGASVEGTYLNVKNGPIYIGKDAEVSEASAIRAPFAACEHAVVNMGARITGATTLGPFCKVGGELNNVVMIGYSNKAHDGFLGNAVIGEWCNIGGGTTASNLKNDYTEIKLWNYPAQRFLKTGLQFCGLIMADHSKTGINCMFNTATVLGVGVNIHGAGFPRNFVASFSEGSTSGFIDVPISKFFGIAQRMMARRNKVLDENDRKIFETIYESAENYK